MTINDESAGAALERELPLFPLSSPLFPGGAIPLRVFELRYTDMVVRVMKKDSLFGICLLLEGPEAGPGGVPRDVGTVARIVDFGQLDSGFLRITVRGGQRFRVCSRRQRRDGLWMARVRVLAPEPPMDIPRVFVPLSEMLRDIHRQLGNPFGPEDQHYDDAGWVSARLVELLPLDNDLKQSLLESSDPVERLERLRPAISRLSRA
jgi:Lon protease-like protein